VALNPGGADGMFVVTESPSRLYRDCGATDVEMDEYSGYEGGSKINPFSLLAEGEMDFQDDNGIMPVTKKRHTR
jgi:hypothetical protein